MPIERQGELRRLRRSILEMGAAVHERLGAVVEALLEGDVAAAQQVSSGDAPIDAMDIDIEAECLRVLALTQPVAGDLRFVLAAMRVNALLERIGDGAASIARRVIALKEGPPLELPSAVRSMAVRTREMLSSALEALADGNIDLARRVRRADAQIDDLQREVFAWAQSEIPRRVEVTQSAIDVLSITRKLERIADMCTGITEEVIFLVEGEIVRHTPK